MRAVQQNKPFVGIAAQEESAVQDELSQPGGRRAIVQKGAQRLETVARLYWGAIQKASIEGDVDSLTKYVKTFGWLQSSAIRAMETIDRIKDGDGAISPDDIIARYRGKDDTAEHS
jgi:hypothetical protein